MKMRHINRYNNLNDAKSRMNKGLSVIKTQKKEIFKQVGMMTLGSVAGGMGVMLADKLTSNSSNTLQYAVGTLTSGAISVLGFSYDKDYFGMGAASVACMQAANTATTLLFDKSIAEIIAPK